METILQRMEIILQQIASNTSPSDGDNKIFVSGSSSYIRTRLSPTLHLDKTKKYEMALVNLDTYYSFPNISSENNLFKYSPDNGQHWFTITLEEGCYELTDINTMIQNQMQLNDHWDIANKDAHISLSADRILLKTVLDISDGYKVDFTVNNTLRSLLGFNSYVYSSGCNKSENIVNILNINSVFVNVNIISGAFHDKNQLPTIFSFFPNVSPGFKIVVNPQSLVYSPIILNKISTLETTITDQLGKELNLRGETINIMFHIKQIK